MRLIFLIVLQADVRLRVENKVHIEFLVQHPAEPVGGQRAYDANESGVREKFFLHSSNI
jgi:hypothetical protein